MNTFTRALKAGLAAALCILLLSSAGRPVRTARHLYVAAADSDPKDKKLADFRCTGVHDELTINQAIASLPYGGTVQLLDRDVRVHPAGVERCGSRKGGPALLAAREGRRERHPDPQSQL